MKKAINSFGLLLGGIALGTVATISLQQFSTPKEIRKPIDQQRPSKTKLPVFIKGDPAIGSIKAPITIVEFSDFECPYCKRFHDDVLPHLKKHYIDKGLIRFVHKDLPLPFHQYAFKSASIARCAATDLEYWKIYHALFDRQNCLSCHGPLVIAKNSGADEKQLQACASIKGGEAPVNINVSEASILSIKATPTFIIGRSQGEKLQGLIIEGALPWAQFKRILDKEISHIRKQST